MFYSQKTTNKKLIANCWLSWIFCTLFPHYSWPQVGWSRGPPPGALYDSPSRMGLEEAWRQHIIHRQRKDNIQWIKWLKMGYRLGLQTISISCTTWGVHSLATSSSFLGEVSRSGDSGGWFQQHRYISVVDMKGRSSIWQLCSGSSLQGSITSRSAPDLRGSIFSGVSLLRSSLWLGEPGGSSAFWGLSLALLPLDFCPFTSPKKGFLPMQKMNILINFQGPNTSALE